MNMATKIASLILQYFIGVIFAFVFGVFFWCLCFLPAMILHIAILYVDTMVYLMIFLAFPIGGTLGISYVDKRMLKREKSDKGKILGGFFIGVFGILLVFWIIPVIYNIRLFDWFGPIFGEGMDIFLFPFVAVFFSLIGYNSLGIFRKLFYKASTARFQGMDKKVKTHVGMADKTDELPKLKWQIIGTPKFALIILSISILLIFLLIVCRPTPWKAERKARAFLEKVITSVNNDTDFYKKRSKENAVSDMEEHKTMISNNYIIEVFNNEGPYEYFVTFDEKYTFKVDINRSREGLILYKFYFIPGKVGYRLNRSD